MSIDDKVVQFRGVSMNVEVSTMQGPVLPLVKNVHTMGVLSLAEERLRATERAQANDVSDADMHSAGFTFVDLSESGVKTFTPIVTPNQAATLAIGAIQQATAMDVNKEMKVSRHSHCSPARKEEKKDERGETRERERERGRSQGREA